MAIPLLAGLAADASAQGAQADRPMVLSASEPNFTFQTEFLFNRLSKVRREIIGPVAEGFRFNIFVEEAEVIGPKIKGRCTVGGDWFTVRRDGMGVIDSKVTIITDSGELIFTYYEGMTDLGEGAYEKILSGERPTVGKVFVAARFQTSSPKYKWLNRTQAIGVGTNKGDYNYWSTYALR